METPTLNKYDFKKYLLANLSDARQEDLIFWKKSIPLPVDLVFNIFEKRGELFKKYLDQIASVCLYNYILKMEENSGILLLEALPSENQKPKNKEISAYFKKYNQESKVTEVINKIAAKLFIVEYNFFEDDFINTLCHEGRKFKRLYVPQKIKDIIRKDNPEVLKIIGVSNGDMFGNIVADELGIYRSGFSDAFAAIFNKLLDFVIENTGSKTINYSSASTIKITQVEDEKLEYSHKNLGTVVDGSLWEPRYLNAKSSFVVNIKHPYFEILKNKNSIDLLNDFAALSSLIENDTIKDIERKILENFRHELSRQLRLIAEKD